MPTPPHRRPRRGVRLILASLLLTGLSGVAAAVTVNAAPPAAAATTATFWDDFNGPAGSSIDLSKWRVETGDNVNNHEREYYTSGTHNAALDGQGHLVITARRDNPGNYQCWYGTCQYTSARFSTAGMFTQAYGHFESRMQLPKGQGMWPAFWMLGDNIGTVGWPNSGEIDTMENVGYEPGTVHGTLHGPGYSGSNGLGAAYTLPGGQSFSGN
jgi:beta-glucanase (GH16 family)